MIVVTTDTITGRKITASLGWAKGSTIRARHIGKDIMASLRNVVGGEVIEYTKMMAEAREEAIARMVEDAEKMGANAVVGLRFSTSMVMQNAAEILAYGTAVVLE
jgi:uncharacterized protein YbjQ (UPF0145 family)